MVFFCTSWSPSTMSNEQQCYYHSLLLVEIEKHAILLSMFYTHQEGLLFQSTINEDPLLQNASCDYLSSTRHSLGRIHLFKDLNPHVHL